MSALLKNTIVGKRFLVTGGTGSFGRYITYSLLQNGAGQVTVFSRDEDKQYTMQFDFLEYKDRLKFYIGDIRDKESIIKATQGIDVVIHAAALKQIPSTENNVIEAVKTNVIGAQNVVDACISNNVTKAIAISTDKAVEPVNTMGMTKALQEKIFVLGNKQQWKTKTKFALVRYGNVIASRGSVIPLFKRQIDKGGPVTITHPDMTRFILTLSQGIGLVYIALASMKGGEIFVPRIYPLRVKDLAEVMIETRHPKNREIIEVGIRPGEKLHETLISQMETSRVVRKRDYYIIYPQIDDKEIAYTYKVKFYTPKKIFRYSSDIGPFIPQKEIKNILIEDGVFT